MAAAGRSPDCGRGAFQLTRTPKPISELLPVGYDGFVFDCLDSTNEEAKRWGENFNGVPLWIMAREQTAGRGRRGRVWVSEEGNLFASLLYPRPAEIEQASQFGFVAALAVRDLAKTVLPDDIDVALKWPNDVLVEGKKVSGILLESASGAGVHPWIVIGIGVNLSSAPSQTLYPATWLGDKGKFTPKPLDALKILAETFDYWVKEWQRDGFLPIQQAWRKHGPLEGSPLVVRTNDEEFEGQFLKIDVKGALHIVLPDGSERRILAGDVFALDED